MNRTQELIVTAREAAEYLERRAWRRRKRLGLTDASVTYRMYDTPERLLKRLRAALKAAEEES